MTVEANAMRMAEVYRLHLGGLDAQQIAEELTTPYQLVGAEVVLSDLEMIRKWEEQYSDPEKIRTEISLELDTLFRSILADLHEGWVPKQARAKSEFYREAREILMQKALLYGLNTQNLNVNQKSKLWTVIQELRNDATQLEAEADYPALAEPQYLPVASTPAEELLVESDSANRW